MRVHIHANCQAPNIAALLTEARPDWQISYFEVQIRPIIDRFDDYRRAIERADVVISQPIRNAYNNRTDLGTEWVFGNARSNSIRIGFPSLHFNGDHIGFGHFTGIQQPFEWSALMMHELANGATAKSAVSMMLDEEAYPTQLIENAIQISINEMTRREATMLGERTIASDFLKKWGGHTQLTHVINHPMRPMYAHVINQILRILDVSERINVRGADRHGVPHVPACRAVRRYWSRFSPPHWAEHFDPTARANGWGMCERDFYETMASDMMALGRDEMSAAISRSEWARDFLARYDVATA